jgi:2-succinyl-6-hydroxy-2,4-cyclohexadiene-1-carboxylate synthase
VRVCLVHGFTQSASSWSIVEPALRGGSLAPEALDVPDDLDFVQTAAALGDLGGRAAYVGYSMGGRLCLQLALDRPELVERLVLVSASPGIADDADRRARRAADERLAVEVERDGVAAFLERWVAQPMFSQLPRAAAQLEARVAANTVERMTHQLRALGQGAQPSNWARLHEIAAPTALYAGDADAKYVDIAHRMAPALRAEVQVLSGDHACHLEPNGFPHRLASWLESA